LGATLTVNAATDLALGLARHIPEDPRPVAS